MEQKETIGYLLRKSREKQSLSLDEVANKTKISINMLRFLEGNQLDQLPNKTFVKGFVQNYSKCVGIDLNLAADTLENTYRAQQPEEEVVADQEPVKEESGLSIEQLEVREKIINAIHAAFDKRIIIGIVVLVAVVGTIKLITSFFSQISKEQVNVAKITGQDKNPIKDENSNLFDLEASKKFRDQNQPAEKPVNASPAQAPVENKVEASAKVAESKPTPEPEKVEEASKKEEEPKQQNLNGKYPYKEFYTISGKMYDIVPDSPLANDENMLPSHIKEAALPGKANVFINANKGDTWISYKVDDENIKRYVLKQGRTLLLKGDIVLLFLGNINVTTIFYNNQLIEVDSRTGVKSLIFPQELAKNYELPLFPTYDGAPLTAEEYKANMAAPPAEE